LRYGEGVERNLSAARRERAEIRVHGVDCPFFDFLGWAAFGSKRIAASNGARNGLVFPAPRHRVGAEDQAGHAQRDAGSPHIARYCPEPGGIDAVLPGVAVAARRTAALAAVHPAPPMARDRR